MLRALLWTVRQRRYAVLAAVMAALALGCIGAGTFELHRFHEKRHDNGLLRVNAHAAAVPLTTSLVPLAGNGATPGTKPAAGPGDLAIRYRTVTARGTYDVANEQYVDDQSQGGRQGFLVLTPLRTASGTLLVARGFVASTSTGARPAVVAVPPQGLVTVSGRLYAGQHASDRFGRLGNGEITAVNPTQQAARLGRPVFDAYAVLTAAQPGTAGLRVLPRPDLSNPTGGAGEVQLLSYVVQWYVFALLALIAPFVLARSEVREARRRFLGIDPDAEDFDLRIDRVRQLELAASAESGANDGAGTLAVRERGEAARAGAVSPRLERAERLADRYGRSLGPDLPPGAGDEPAVRDAPVEAGSRTSATAPHRSVDDHHGSYNDYLWQLALADGNIPTVLRSDSAGADTGHATDATDDPGDDGNGPRTAR